MTPPDQPDRTGAAPLDREFLVRLRRRDGEAMERFFELYYDRLFGHVVRLVRDTHLAEDLAHEVFMRLQRVLDRLDPDRDPTAWVFTVATNVVRDHWRSRRHKETERSTGLTAEHLEVVPDDADDAEAALARRQQQRAIREALSELAEADREVIVLRDYENLDAPTVAEIIGIKPDAVRQRHSRAVSRLGSAYRRQLDRDGTTP